MTSLSNAESDNLIDILNNVKGSAYIKDIINQHVSFFNS